MQADRFTRVVFGADVERKVAGLSAIGYERLRDVKIALRQPVWFKDVAPAARPDLEIHCRSDLDGSAGRSAARWVWYSASLSGVCRPRLRRGSMPKLLATTFIPRSRPYAAARRLCPRSLRRSRAKAETGRSATGKGLLGVDRQPHPRESLLKSAATATSCVRPQLQTTSARRPSGSIRATVHAPNRAPAPGL